MDHLLILLIMFSSLYHISGEVVKEEAEEMPKEVAQNGLENSEKGRSFFRKLILIIDEILKSSFLKIDAQVEVFSNCANHFANPDMEKKVLGGLFQINPVTKTGQRLYMVSWFWTW